MDEITRQELLDELCPRLRPIVQRLMDCPCGCETLEFFRLRTHVWLESTDIAHHLHQSVVQVGAALMLLTEIGIMERREILGKAFYGLTHNEETLNGLEQFWAWRDDWHMRLEQVRSTLQLSSGRAV